MAYHNGKLSYDVILENIALLFIIMIFCISKTSLKLSWFGFKNGWKKLLFLHGKNTKPELKNTKEQNADNLSG